MQVAHPAPEVLSMQAAIGENDVTGRETGHKWMTSQYCTGRDHQQNNHKL